MTKDVELRQLEETDWPILRSLRLRALEEDPNAFGPSVEEARAADEAYWRRWASGQGGLVSAWIVSGRSEPVGLISCSVRSERVGHFGALWVDPRFRRLGLARRLVERVCDWLHDRGCQVIQLDMTEGNPVERLYVDLGFERTGAQHPLREGSDLVEVTMVRRLPVAD